MTNDIPFRQKSIEAFLEELAGETPTLPAAGSALGLAGAIASALYQFAVRLTLKRAREENSGGSFNEMLLRLEKIKNGYLQLMDADVKAYEEIIQALKMPHDTDEERNHRENALQEARIGAQKPPMQLTQDALEMLRLTLKLATEGYSPALADIGVAMEIARACLLGGLLIARSNLRDFADAQTAEEQTAILETCEREGDHLYNKAKDEMKKRL